MQRYQELKDTIAVLGMDELPEDKALVCCAYKMQQVFSQAMFVAEPFAGQPGD